jgi:hypothetical protein
LLGVGDAGCGQEDGRGDDGVFHGFLASNQFSASRAIGGVGHALRRNARSISTRIASDRVQPLVFAHSSRRAISSFGNRNPIMGSRPVAGLPRPRFFGLADIDCARAMF